MSKSVSVLATADGTRVSAWRKKLTSNNTICTSRLLMNTWDGLAGAMGRVATTVGGRSLIWAGLVLATAIMLPSGVFAAPVGAVGPALILKPGTGEDPPITFTFKLGGNIGSGSLMATYVGDGNYRATSGTLTMAPTSTGDPGKTYCLVPVGDSSGPYWTSPGGGFLYDDLVSPGADPAFPTIYGLLFTNTHQACGSGFDGANEINIWATDTPPSNPRSPGHYSFYDGVGAAYGIVYITPPDSSDSFNATAITTTYSYAGRGFNLFQCLTNPTQDCSSPGAGNPYGSSNSVTAALQLAAPLCSTSGSCSTDPVNVCGTNFVGMTLNDGVNTVSVSNSSCNHGATAWVATDLNGNINAWYLDATGGGTKDIHTLYDPGPAHPIAALCNGCYANSAKGSEQDYGQFSPTSGPPLFYGYNLGSHGSFTTGYTGGTTTAGACGNGQACTLVPGNTFTIKGPNAGVIPSGALLTEQECVVLADPRGPNCGAVNGHLPRSLNVSDLPQCAGFGNEVIPDYLCGASGSSATGFALILGNAEQIDTFNGTYGDSVLDVEKVPDLQGSATNPTCPKGLPGTLPGVPSALAAVATRSGSLVEEQTPERTLDGRPLLIEMTSGCDPPVSNHGPGLTLEGMGFKLRTDDPAMIGGLTRVQRLLVFANYKYLNLDAVLLLTKFPTNTPTRKNLQNCVNKSQSLLNSGPSHYSCAAEQIYRCEQIVEPGTDFREFGPNPGPFLRLPDPYGDAVRRLGNLYYTINTRINGQHPNADWPLSADPYPGQCP